MSKQIIIYGKNRYQRDFEYIFSGMEIAYYVSDEISDEGVYHFSVLEQEDKNNIC